MNKLQAIKSLILNPVSVVKNGLRIENEQNHRKKVLSKYKIERLPTINILDLIPGMNLTIDNYSFLNGTSLVTDIALLKSLSGNYEKCAYLEIGSWRGESIVNVADVTDDCTSVTLSEQEMREMKFDENFIRVHGAFSKGAKGIRTIGHNSHTFNFAELEKKFDLIFIDGDHTFSGVLDDTNKVFPLRKSDESIIVWHDYGMNTEEVRYSVLNAILDGIPAHLHKNLYHVSNTLCAVYIEGKNFKTSYTVFPSIPDKKFRLQISCEKL